jgi:hypothetical protein
MPGDPPALYAGEGRAQMKTPAQWPGLSSLEAAGFQCITVTANTTMMAALREPITANGRSSLRYCIATPHLVFALQRRSAPFWFDNQKKKSGCICQRGIRKLPRHRCRSAPPTKKEEPWLAPQVAAQRPQQRPDTPSFTRHATRQTPQSRRGCVTNSHGRPACSSRCLTGDGEP